MTETKRNSALSASVTALNRNDRANKDCHTNQHYQRYGDEATPRGIRDQNAVENNQQKPWRILAADSGDDADRAVRGKCGKPTCLKERDVV